MKRSRRCLQTLLKHAPNLSPSPPRSAKPTPLPHTGCVRDVRRMRGRRSRSGGRERVRAAGGPGRRPGARAPGPCAATRPRKGAACHGTHNRARRWWTGRGPGACSGAVAVLGPARMPDRARGSVAAGGNGGCVVDAHRTPFASARSSKARGATAAPETPTGRRASGNLLDLMRRSRGAPIPAARSRVAGPNGCDPSAKARRRFRSPTAGSGQPRMATIATE